MNYKNDDDIYTDSDLTKSISNVNSQIDKHLSQLGTILKTPISQQFRQTLLGLIVKVVTLEKLNYEKNKRQLESSFPKDMKWS
tara:strand:+ start:10 stop:258 length:249 start_codon:yes stop_codon:yes gene_type:complete